MNLESEDLGISFLDVSTGEFYLAQGSTEYIDKLIQTFQPSEIVVQKNKRQNSCELFGNKYYINTFRGLGLYRLILPMIFFSSIFRPLR